MSTELIITSNLTMIANPSNLRTVDAPLGVAHLSVYVTLMLHMDSTITTPSQPKGIKLKLFQQNSHVASSKSGHYCLNIFH